MKKLLEICFVFLIITCSSGMVVKTDSFVIDAAKNASMHNNLGINYLKEFDYYSAIKEFEIAIQINPNSQASATYYNNLGTTYMKIGYYSYAERCFMEAYKRNNANFDYYHNIVLTYKAQGKLKQELAKYLIDSKANSAVFAGLILIEMGKIEAGINKLDEFCFDQPEMILTKGVREYIQEIAPREFRF